MCWCFLVFMHLLNIISFPRLFCGLWMDNMYSFCILLCLCPQISTEYFVASTYLVMFFFFLYFKTSKLQENRIVLQQQGNGVVIFLNIYFVHLSTAMGPFYDYNAAHVCTQCPWLTAEHTQYWLFVHQYMQHISLDCQHFVSIYSYMDTSAIIM